MQVFEGIRCADAFLVFGTADYGEDTGNPACTYHELKYARHKGKCIIPLRMIPWGVEFEHVAADVFFGSNMLTLSWEAGTPMPPTLVKDILNALPRGPPVADVSMRRISSAPPRSPESGGGSRPVTTVATVPEESANRAGSLPLSATSTMQISTAAAFAEVCGATLDELVSMFSVHDVMRI